MHDSDTATVEAFAVDLARAGQPGVAIDALTAALSDRPDVGAWRRLLATLLYREDRLDEAHREAERALELVPLSAEAWLALAEGYFRRGQRRSAADVLLALSTDEAFPAELWSPLFDGLFRLGRWQAALAVSRRAAERCPEDDLAYFSMAQATLRARQPVSRAIHLLERAIGLNPQEPRYRVTLAVQLLGVGRRGAAYSCLAALDASAIESLTCQCCLDKFLRLVIERGDAQRAAWLASRLAILASESSTPKGPVED